MNASIWNQETIDRAEKLWREGHSAAHIGNQFKVSRNAVLGMVFRVREKDETRFPTRHISQGPRAVQQVKSTKRQPKSTNVNYFSKPTPDKVTTPKEPFKPAEPVIPVVDGKDYDAARIANGAKILLERKPGQCCWPLDENEAHVGRFLFCAADVVDRYQLESARGLYCEHHLKRRSQVK